MIKTMTANQKMAELFQRNKSTTSRHIRNVSESGEPKQDPCTARLKSGSAVSAGLQSGSSCSLDGKGC